MMREYGLLPLFRGPDYDLLRETILHRFERAQIEIGLLGDWVVAETPFLRTHIKKQLLVPMEKEGALTVVNPKASRRPCTYPDGTIIKFL